MIRVNDLSRTFIVQEKDPGLKGMIRSLFNPRYKTVTAVDAMDFHIRKGEIVGYLGPNGAGKSTTIKMMTGILQPSGGRCSVNGLDPFTDRMAHARGIGVVFGQRTQLWWDLPLSETYGILREIYEIPQAEYDERLAFLKEVLEIDQFMASPVRTLSLGQRMRADLAASLLHNPPVLFLDEPTIGLDIMVKERIREAILAINRQYSTTVVLTTHDLQDVEELCERVIVIDHGRLIYDGQIDSLKKDYGYMRKVIFETHKPQTLKELRLPTLDRLDPADCRIHAEGAFLHIEFNKKKITLPRIIKLVTGRMDIIDLSVHETDIEEIIKRIYRNGVHHEKDTK